VSTRDFRNFDLLTTSVVLLDQSLRVVFCNQSAEVLFGVSSRQLEGSRLSECIGSVDEVEQMLHEAIEHQFDAKRQHLTWQLPTRGVTQLDTTVTAQRETDERLICIELREIDQQRRLDREERQADLTQANKELMRNLAHEIKNPLGGVRGAAQLLDAELPSDDLREYTQVIIKEADRLQGLVDQMLAPHRKARVMEPVNIHVVLNVARNAAQALGGQGAIILQSRVARQVTIAKTRHKLALDLHVIDDGPGIPEEIRERVFYPLVSGHPQGHGLGLTLAQSFVHQHGGVIDVTSRPGCTDFLIRLPIDLKWSQQ
jgi:two-component system nitrogen regulation sensor histidine kinase GlnL